MVCGFRHMFDVSLIAQAPILSLFIGLVAVLSVSISKAGFGGAMGSLSMPIMLLIFTPTLSLGILLPLFIIIDVWVVWSWRHLGSRRIILFLTISGLLGQLLGWALLRIGAIDDNILTLFISLLALYTGGKYFIAKLFHTQSAKAARAVVKQYRDRIISRAFLWGGLSGFSSFVSLTGGIPAQVYLLPLGLSRQMFVATMAWYLLFINVAKIPFFTDLSFIDVRTLTVSALLLPAVPVGIMIGRWLNRTMSDTIFYAITHGLLIVLGLQLFGRFWNGAM